MLTFEKWLKQFDNSLVIHGRIAEDGYAWYLEQKLGRIPTIQEIKEYGKIVLLTTE